MINDLALNAAPYARSIIGEHGFVAMLRNDGTDTSGVIGTSRIDPTGNGLWIQDSHAAAIDTILIALLEDFVKNGTRARRPEQSVPPVPGRRRSRRHRDECKTSGELVDEVDVIAA